MAQGATSTTRILRESPAYRSGWEDGRFGPLESFAAGGRLVDLSAEERLAYYRGHRDGRRIREMLKGGR
jgi:hypothetical protein